MSATVIDGVPYINNKPAIPCKEDDEFVQSLGGAIAPWKCPECGSHLAGSLICMRGCHLTAAQYMRFQSVLTELFTRNKNDDQFGHRPAIETEGRARDSNKGV